MQSNKKNNWDKGCRKNKLEVAKTLVRFCAQKGIIIVIIVIVLIIMAAALALVVSQRCGVPHYHLRFA